MKTTLVLIFSLLFLGYEGISQDVKHQTEELATIKIGSYRPYLTKQDDNGKYQGGLSSLVYEIVDIKDYRIDGKHKEVYLYFGENADRSSDGYKKKMYLTGNLAFPITYVQKVFEGNKTMQEEIGFAPRINRYSDVHRLVFLDGRIYVLEDWKDKDNYELKMVLEFQEKRLTGLKLMKEVMKSPKKMEALQPHKILQKYLDQAYAKQQKVYAKWLQNTDNKRFEENIEATRKLIIGAINKQRDDWYNSAEYKRIKENNQYFAQHQQQNYTTVNNRTGRDIYIYAEGSSNGSRVSANGSGRCDCKKNQYYSFSGNSSASQGTLIISANQNCGQQVTVE